MNCSKFMKLSDQEQKEFLGRVIHCAISSNIGFDSGVEMIAYGEEAGHFEGVKIGHEAMSKAGDDLANCL